MQRIIGPIIAALVTLSLSASAVGARTNIAVAANFTATAKEIAAAFKASTGYEALLSFGSTGKLYAQIIHAAPFSVFLAADAERPILLEANGLTVPDSRFTYAKGKLAIYSPEPDLVNESLISILQAESINKLAIANPKTAPYGRATLEYLQKHSLWDNLRSKIVRGENISQTYQFVVSRNAQAGFVALSQLTGNEKGAQWVVPETDYSPIEQQAVLLKRSAGDPVALAFYQFLKGPEAQGIVQSYGYGTD